MLSISKLRKPGSPGAQGSRGLEKGPGLPPPTHTPFAGNILHSDSLQATPTPHLA